MAKLIRNTFCVNIWMNDLLRTFIFPPSEVEPFVELVRKYGYNDAEGNNLFFERAQVDDDGSLTIYLSEEGE